MNIQSIISVYSQNKSKFFLKNNSNYASKMKQLCKRYRIQNVAKRLNVSQRMLYYYCEEKRNIDISVIKKISDYYQVIVIDDSESVEISTHGHNAAKIPIEVSPILAYLIGILAGDGHISRRGDISIVNNSHQYLKNTVAPIFQKIFQIETGIIKTRNYYELYVSNKVVNHYLSKYVGLPQGKKTGKLRVPSVIDCKEKKREFISGVFETDGGITFDKYGRYSILISSSTPEFLLQLQNILKEFEIMIPGPYRSGNRRGGEIRSFRKQVIRKFKKEFKIRHLDRIRQLKPL
jgi:intein/homing endonuclease